ncbi:unnamed protein product, partial [Cuscuta europaea]
MPIYSLHGQNKIICSCFALHNYIRKSKIGDPGFTIIDQDPNFIPDDIFRDVESTSAQSVEHMRIREMAVIRDNIASSLMAARRSS